MWKVKCTSNTNVLVPQLSESSSPGDPWWQGRYFTLLNLTMSSSGSNVQGKQNHCAQAGSISSARFLWPPDSPHQVIADELSNTHSCLTAAPLPESHKTTPSSYSVQQSKALRGAESRLREEQKGCKAYYRDGNAEPSFSTWTWPLHLLHRCSMQCLT